jgi:hypothetical protein
LRSQRPAIIGRDGATSRSARADYKLDSKRAISGFAGVADHVYRLTLEDRPARSRDNGIVPEQRDYPGMTRSDAKRGNDEMSEMLLFSALTVRGVENRPADAALKLGGDGPFRNVSPQFGYWLGSRGRHGFGA